MTICILALTELRNIKYGASDLLEKVETDITFPFEKKVP